VVTTWSPAVAVSRPVWAPPVSVAGAVTWALAVPPAGTVSAAVLTVNGAVTRSATVNGRVPWLR
jgi:hypothetical protein